MNSNTRSPTRPGNQQAEPRIVYQTPKGYMIQGYAEQVLPSRTVRRFRHRVQLILTSPPFPLLRKKRYGNLEGFAYVEWFARFAPIFREFLKPNGSIVVEIGNAWEPGLPVMSTFPMEALLAFLRRGSLRLCEQFIGYNKARLPSPAQWVNVERIRVKDAYTSIWWMSPSIRPKASNRRVLKEYSDAMKELLARSEYNHGRRPSEHRIGPYSFLKDNDGAIPSNVLVVANTKSTDGYLDHCRRRGLAMHPARMPDDVAAFFINFLTGPGDIVMDPFAGSNVTGAVAERLGRKWISIEKDRTYALSSRARFDKYVR